MGIKLSDVKTSRFFKKEDLGDAGKMLVTIKGASKMNVAPAGQPIENKVVVHFVEVEKPLVLNLVNFSAIVAATGSDDSDGWLGKKMVIYFDPSIMYSGKITGGLRLRKPVTKNPPTPVQVAAINQVTQESVKQVSTYGISDASATVISDDDESADIF